MLAKRRPDCIFYCLLTLVVKNR
ncbi:hypothetical protein CUJ84_Chr004739 [Rhizobium leguminosarum]|uniref:Uncharacterized protein n=1 Tax=Rhizobium leguminosarum TaxID=384 RepID=A0A2K9Z9Y1_RHILE|nr:hypothetical protein CUJ84_Chr004739 [Rhizobium leguminosarum]